MKKVDITGTHNRYQIKKVTRTTADSNKPRVATIGWMHLYILLKYRWFY